MQEGDLTALITAAVIVPAALLISTNTRLNRSYRLLSTALLFLGVAKLVRVRYIVDTHIEPLLSRLFGVHNLPVAIAAVCAIVAYTLVAITLSTARRSRAWATALATSASAIFLALFAASYGAHFRPYLSSGGVDSPLQAITWAIPLGYVGVASGAIAILGTRARLEAHSSILAKNIGDLLILMGVFGIIYLVTKGGYVAVSTIDREAAILPLLATAGLVAFPASSLFLAISVFLPGVGRIVDRTSRYRALRAEGVQENPAHLWQIAADEQETHRVIIDHSDQTILGKPHTAR